MTEYAEKFARQTIKVDGQEVEVIILGEGADLPIGFDISSEMDRVASQLAYWGSVAAAARAENILADSWYRRFRAQAIEAQLAADPKVAEWKARAAVEGSDGFIQHKQAIAVAERNLALAEAMVKAFDKKANQLQSRGAALRSEIDAQGMTTRRAPVQSSAEKKPGWDLSGEGSEQDDAGLPESTPTRSEEEMIDKMKQIFAPKGRKKPGPKPGSKKGQKAK